MRHGNPRLRKEIKEAKRKAAASQSEYRRVARKAQTECEHLQVVEAPWSPARYFGPSPAVRVCCNCGLTEYDKWGSEHGGSWQYPATRDWEPLYDKKHVLTTEFVKRVSREEAMRMRIEV